MLSEFADGAEYLGTGLDRYKLVIVPRNQTFSGLFTILFEGSSPSLSVNIDFTNGTRPSPSVFAYSVQAIKNCIVGRSVRTRLATVYTQYSD